VYSDKPAIETGVKNGRLWGKLVFKKAMVPLKSGTVSIPPFAISYFDPEQEQYCSFTSQRYVLNVRPGKETENLQAVGTLPSPAMKKDVTMVEDDILPLHLSLRALENRQVAAFHPIALVLLFAPAAAFCAGWVIKRRGNRQRYNSELVRSRKALATLRRRLKATDSSDNVTGQQQASRAFKEYLGDKFNTTGSALTAHEVFDRLSAGKVDQDLARQIYEILEQMERAHYTSSGPVLRHPELCTAIMSLAKKLEKELP
jgi:hypothetical protein